MRFRFGNPRSPHAALTPIQLHFPSLTAVSESPDVFVGGARYVGYVAEVRILTPRGVQLSGTFVDPVDSTDAAVVFSHSLLCDRTSSPHFARLAAHYRSLGYATLMFDYSGHGLSDDDVITTELRQEDLRAVSSWLAERGFSRQILHAHSTGTIAAVKAHPPAVKTMFLTSPVLGPMDYDWEAIFSEKQLRDVETTGRMRVPDDSPGPREAFAFTSQTLIDLSLNSAEDLLAGLTVPIALVFDHHDTEHGLVQSATEAFALLPDGSRLDIVEDTDFSDEGNLDRLCGMSGEWVERHVPVSTEEG